MESIGAGGILMPLYALISWYSLIKDDDAGEYEHSMLLGILFIIHTAHILSTLS